MKYDSNRNKPNDTTERKTSYQVCGKGEKLDGFLKKTVRAHNSEREKIKKDSHI